VPTIYGDSEPGPRGPTANRSHSTAQITWNPRCFEGCPTTIDASTHDYTVAPDPSADDAEGRRSPRCETQSFADERTCDLAVRAPVDSVDMSMIFDVLASLLGPDVGSRKRRRKRAEMWETRSFPASRRSERYQSWVAGTGQVAPHTVTFIEQGGATSTTQISDAVLGGSGPTMPGPSVLLTTTTTSGSTYVLAVPSEYGERILAALVAVE